MSAFQFSNDNLKVALNGKKLSEFDIALRTMWDEAMKLGLFRYDLSELQTKILPGPHRYVALLNTRRATDRRPPESMFGLNQAFDGSRFNFNKVLPAEVLMSIQNTDDKQYNDKILINVSPVDYAHSLIVPQIDENLNQNLTHHALKLSLEIMSLSVCRSFRIGFNSLCAHASVNHQHLHCYYTEQVLPAETMIARPVSDHLFMLESDAPTGYAFQLTSADEIERLSKKLFTCTNFMRKSEIAHALFLTRGQAFDNPYQQVIRIFLWPRVKLLGAKPTEVAFNSAVLEMAGHLLIKDKLSYETITDDEAYTMLREASLPNNEFNELTENLLNLLESS